MKIRSIIFARILGKFTKEVRTVYNSIQGEILKCKGREFTVRDCFYSFFHTTEAMQKTSVERKKKGKRKINKRLKGTIARLTQGRIRIKSFDEEGSRMPFPTH